MSKLRFPKNILNDIKVIAFDADDTLWVNEPYYQDAEMKFCNLLNDFLPKNKISKELLKTENKNIVIYGYGAKGFTLSMIETALIVTKKRLTASMTDEILTIGKSLLNRPIELIVDLTMILPKLKSKYQLIIATKGDLIDQQRKIEASGLKHFFEHIEIMSNKKESDYIELLNKLSVKPKNFLMIGNSLKSDILPVISIGGKAIYVPFHTTWEHEKIEVENKENILTVTNLLELTDYLI